MAQHDQVISDQAGLAFLSDLNNALTAIFSNNSGATAPADTAPYMWWADTTAGWLKQRNAADNAWINKMPLADAMSTVGSSLFSAADAAAARTAIGAVIGTDVQAYAASASQVEMEAGTESALRAMSPLRVAQAIAALGGGGSLEKADPAAVAFTKTGAGTAEIKAGTKASVAGTLVEFSTATAITMPTLTAGTDYAIWVKDDATIQATTNFSSAPGAGNWRKIGGFHYAPGGNATGTSGGDTTPAINAYSLWDLKFRPACPDPRGMTLVADSFWADIYLLGVDHLTNGTSKYNVTIADGSSPPKKPTKFGGNGTTTQTDGNWWNLTEVAQSWGKRPPAYDEFAALAYGTTEASSLGSDPGSTVLNAAYTSKWGVIQSTGVLWSWGYEFGGGAAGASWTANTQGRGSTYQMENAALFGGAWDDTSNSGSRASYWVNSPTSSSGRFGLRCVCDHLITD